MQEVHVKKRGNVHIVYLNENHRPTNLGSYEDEPVGTFPMTYLSRQEVESSWGTSLKVFEAATKPVQVIHKDINITRMAEAVLGGKSVESAMQGQTPAVTPIARILTSPKLNEPDSQKLRANEIVKRYEVALHYANAKAKRELDIKISALKELISEVFGE